MVTVNAREIPNSNRLMSTQTYKQREYLTCHIKLLSDQLAFYLSLSVRMVAEATLCTWDHSCLCQCTCLCLSRLLSSRTSEVELQLSFCGPLHIFKNIVFSGLWCLCPIYSFLFNLFFVCFIWTKTHLCWDCLHFCAKTRFHPSACHRRSMDIHKTFRRHIYL